MLNNDVNPREEKNGVTTPCIQQLSPTVLAGQLGGLAGREGGGKFANNKSKKTECMNFQLVMSCPGVNWGIPQ